MLLTPHQEDIVTDGQEPSEETAHGTRAEDQDLHATDMSDLDENPFDVS
jgi:hypothetical protein